MDGNKYQRVRFLKSKAPYNAGDEAGFPANVVHILVSNGYAEPVTAKGAPDIDYRGMSWFSLRAEVKKMTGENPTNKEHALLLLAKKGVI